MLAKYTHSPLAADDILEAEITSSGVQSGLARSAGKFQYLKDALGTVTDIAEIWGGGISGAGGNGLNGWISSNKSYGFGDGLTLGSSSNLFNKYTPDLATHEFGHTVQFIGLAAIGSATGRPMENTWGMYIGLGVLGTSSYGTWWEKNADALGGVK